jgi:GNAT superfamily N-acetyltransferase
VDVRAASPSDAAAIAAVQVRAWQWAYRGLVPDSYLDAMSIDDRTARWRQGLEHLEAGRTFYLIAGERAAAGFVGIGPSRDEDTGTGTGEVYAIYVEPASIGTGLGHALLRHAEDELRLRGFSTAILWVLEGNTRARRFYERHAWRPDGTSKTQDAFDVGADLREVRYRRDLTRPRTGGHAVSSNSEPT